ncbi:MAG: class B sortase [Lachnospiraceae bacterium]|nr:class B sortase [Lachnospiraceae bacterium]
MRNKKKKEDLILLVAGIIFLCIFCISGYFLIDYYVESRKQEELNNQLAQIKHGSKVEGFVEVKAIPITPKPAKGSENTTEEQKDSALQEEQTKESQEASEESEETPALTELNPDYVGWIQMPDTVIDYPMVHKDNSYYLRRDFYGEKNKHGTIFLDESCDAEDTFLLIHGHNMKDGTMFGCLKNLKKESYREEHSELTISWNDTEETYEIFAGALVDLYDENRFRYEKLPQVEKTMTEYLEQLKQHALWYEDVSWEMDKRVIIMSTCDYGTKEQRFIVAAIEKK